MKATLAQFIFESNTFVPDLAEIDLFKKSGTWLDSETEVRAWAAATDSQMQGSLEVLEAAGWETAPCFVALCGSPAGRMSRACFRELAGTFLARIQATAPFDLLVLHLHGASAAVGEDDPEGHILEKLRTELDYRGKLVLSLDLHANFTRRMLQHADAVTAYRTYPHMDFTATGERAARLALHSGPLTRAAAKVAAIMSPVDSTHLEGNFRDLLGRARELELQHDTVLDVCILPVQPWMDVDEMGSSVVVTATDAGVPWMSCMIWRATGTPSVTIGKTGSPPGRRFCESSIARNPNPGYWSTPVTPHPEAPPVTAQRHCSACCLARTIFPARCCSGSSIRKPSPRLAQERPASQPEILLSNGKDGCCGPVRATTKLAEAPTPDKPFPWAGRRLSSPGRFNSWPARIRR